MKLLFLIISFLGICLPDASQEKKPVCKKPQVEKTSFQLMPAGLLIHI
jgi:hypothetical protein